MALLPLLLNLADKLDTLQQLYGADYPHLHYHHNPTSMQFIIPRGAAGNRLAGRGEGQTKKGATIGKEGFQVSMDVQQFKPNELTVKVVDNTVVVEGQHEEREDDYGYISRHFVRKYVLPDGYDPNQAISSLSSDGVLTISVPAPQKSDSKERVVQIQQTGPAHLSVKDNPKEDIDEKDKEKEKTTSKL